jgi:RNA 3'-terminal phosphate cyclase (ATP)
LREVITVDGSIGEGGGQILRTSVSLSIILGTPLVVEKIRSGRPNPGLRPQHLSAIKLLAELFSAKVENLQVGSEWIRFEPPDSPSFEPIGDTADIGTAGSIPLVLMTIVPAVALTRNRASLRIIGGTDVRASPTIDYIRHVVRPAYRAIGLEFSVQVERRGYYPKGGGIVSVDIFPCKQVLPFELPAFRQPPPKIISVCSDLPKHVADRQIAAALAAIERAGLSAHTCTSSIETARSPGSSVLVYSSDEPGVFCGGDCIGELGKRAEEVGREAAQAFLDTIDCRAAVDSHLADMLVLPLSLATGKSAVRTPRRTPHLLTNLHVAAALTGCKYSLHADSDRPGDVVEIVPVQQGIS